MEKNKSPKPVFETNEERDYFKVTFFIHPEFKEEENIKNVSKEPKDTPTQKLPRNYPETTQKILDLIRMNPYITRKELAKKVGDITEDGIKYHLTKLKREGIIKRVGPDRGGYWKIIEDENE